MTWLCCANAMVAQTNDTFADNIRTLQVKKNGEWGEPPVLLLGSKQWLEVSFDDMTHQFNRYIYRITHCDANWQPSAMTVSEYMNGFNDQRIEDYEVSMNTTMEYTHYSFNIPNEEINLRISGNYKVEIFEDGEDEPVAEVAFCVIEPHVNIGVKVSGNTDIDTYQQHQQVDFTVNYKGYNVQDPVGDLKPIVVQNRRWDNHVEGVKPAYLRNNELVFTHNRNLIFEAGNEYRWFEILDEYVATMNVDRMRYIRPYYHAMLFENSQRTHYLYNKDLNGRYWVRNYDNVDNDTESDYFITHFRLVMPAVPGGNVYLHGDLTNGQLKEEYMMDYNLLEHCYELNIPLKQGSYNYQYLFVPDDETQGYTQQCEGNFHQTENEYWIYVYHRPFGERYDKLVGFAQFKYSISE